MNPLFNQERTDIEKYICSSIPPDINLQSKLNVNINDIIYAFCDLHRWDDKRLMYFILIENDRVYSLDADEFHEHFILFSEHRKNKIKKLLESANKA